MQPFNRILVVLDGYEDLPAADGKLPGEVNKALRLLGNSKKAELFLLTCGYEKFLQDSYYNFGDELKVLREEHCKRLEEKLGEVAERVAAQGFSVSAELAWGFPRYEQIIKKSIDCSADLVVQRTRPYGKIARTFLTNDSWQLVRYCPKPLLLVKDRNWNTDPVLLAAVDPVHSRDKPLKLDYKILDSAIALGKQLEGEVHVMHAYAEVGRPFALPDKILKAHQQAFELLLENYQLPAERIHLLDESPVVALEKLEKELRSDILVMGALSRSRWVDALIGNTAEQVLDYLDSDVLIIKPQSIT